MSNFLEKGSDLFDDNFQPLTFHLLGEKLKALELAVVRNAGQFLLSVMTKDIYSERIGEGIEGAPEPVFVVDGDEISPQDLMALKTCSDADIFPYLTDQES